MTPCESLGNSARYLDALADTTPSGLLGTPFGVVCDALRVVAASVWDVDPTVYRAGIAWAWYLGARPSALAVDGLRALLCAALVSECAPLVRESQTVGELVALLSLWMDYRPVFADMEALFATYGVRVDVRAISDPEGQVLMPVDDTRLAFYIFVLSMDWTRPMLLGDIAETARRVSPLGARPFVLLYVEGSVSVPVAPAPTDGFLWVDVWESAVQPIPPAPLFDDATGSISSIALPTAHSGSYIGASFDSLRYYAKAAISNKDDSYRYCYGNATTWFSATLTWHDDTLGDLSDKIATADPSGTERKTQDVLYIVFITNGITGYVPTQFYQISDYTYNNGTHSLTFYAYGTGEWYNQPDAGRIQIRYLDGITTFNNLSVFDLVNISSGILSKDTSTDRFAMYNAWNGDITVHAEYLG